MDVHLSVEQQEQLNDYARRHGQDPAAAAGDVLSAALDWEQQDFKEAIKGIRRGYESVKAGRTRPASEFLNELRAKHGF